MILFFDTETTGKADFRARADAEHQPRLVQLAAILTDFGGKEISMMSCIVRPIGFEIPAEAAAVHGITTEIAVQRGVPVAHALDLFSSLGKLAETFVCHNIEFDHLIMVGECMRMVVDYPNRRRFCTMQQMTDVCQIPGSYGYKWPTLQEAHQHCFGKDFDGAHDALADVRACKDIYFWLQRSRQPATEVKGEH